MRRLLVFQFVLVLLIQLEFSQGQNQCPFPNGLIQLTDIPDSASGLIFEESFNAVVTSVSIFDPILSEIIEADVEGTGPDTKIRITPTQPAFTNILDFQGVELISPVSALEIILDDGTRLTCQIFLTIRDTNNQPPTFSKPSLVFNIPSDWDIRIPLNWELENALQVLDADYKQENAEVSIIDNEFIRGEARPRPADETPPNTFMYDVQLFLKEGVPEPNTYIVTASDGVNEGTIEVEINIIQENLYDPVFQNTRYFHVFENMPAIGVEIPLEIIAIDPDNVAGTDMTYSVATNEHLEYNIESGLFVFTSVDGLEGQLKDFTITATEKNADGQSTDITLSLKFPEACLESLRFKNPFYLFPYSSDWPSVGDIIINDLGSEIEGDAEEDLFFSGEQMPTFIGLVDDTTLKFTGDVNEESELGQNKIVVFDVKVETASGRVAYATFVITFPLIPTTSTTTTTTEPPESTTSCDCSTCPPTTTPEEETPPPTTESSTCSPPTTTPEECTCPSTTTPDDGSSSSTSEPPEEISTATSPSESTDRPITCPSPIPCPSTTTPESSTTPEECNCDSCPTSSPITGQPTTTGEPCPPTSPITGPPTTTGESCPPCTTTPGDCDCNSNPTSSPIITFPTTTPTGETCTPCPTFCPTFSTCSPCQTSTTSEGTCPPCPTTCPACPTTTTTEPCTSTCKPCDCDQDGDGEEDDCSNTGLMVAVIVTSVLCAASICGAGYLVWLLRKATIDPARIQRDNSFLIPKSNSINELYKPDTTSPSDNFRFGNENSRMSFGTGGINTSPIEPGITNPSFSMEQPQPQPTSRRFSVPKTSLSPTTTTPTAVPPPVVTPVEDPVYSQPIKKSNIKSPKEIEPDYEERPVQPERKMSAKPADSSSRIKFAPEDEYISIDKDEAPGGGDGGDANIDLDSDSEYERL